MLLSDVDKIDRFIEVDVISLKDTLVQNEPQTVWTVKAVDEHEQYEGEFLRVLTSHQPVGILGQYSYELKLGGRGFMSLKRLSNGHYTTVSGIDYYIQYYTHVDRTARYSGIQGLYRREYMELKGRLVNGDLLLAKALNNIDTCVTLELEALSVVSIQNLQPNNTWYELSAQVRIQVNTDDEAVLNELNFYIEHDTTFFGTFLANNPNFSVVYPTDFDGYAKVEQSDTSTRVEVTLTLNSGEGGKEVSDTYTDLLELRFKFPEEDLEELVQINMPQPEAVESKITFANQEQKTVECHIVRGGVSDTLRKLMGPQINSFGEATLPAGLRKAGSLLTIDGTRFGSSRGNSRVVFTLVGDTDRSVLGQGVPRAGDYKSWSDNKIEVYVPSDATTLGGSSAGFTAATGDVYIEKDNLNSNSLPIQIPYSVANSNTMISGVQYSQVILLDNQNGAGYYNVAYTTDFSNARVNVGTAFEENFTTIFEEALMEWCASTGYSYSVSANGTISDNACANQINIGFNSSVMQMRAEPFRSNLAVQFPSITLPSDVAKCFQFRINSTRYDIFSRDIIKARLLHEFGHLTMLRHVNNESDLMTPQSGGDQAQAIFGANRVTAISQELNYVKGSCSNSSVTELDYSSDILIIRCGDEICISSVKVPIANVKLYDLLGRLILDQQSKPSTYARLNVEFWSGAGVVSVLLQDGRRVSSQVYF